MGIRGLTTFIQNRSDVCFENYELHDTNVVIDGNSIACSLYKWHCTKKCNDCFGGDYDNYANVIKTFFQLLRDCNVKPYVVFDGGYENKKLATVYSRMKNKIECANSLNSVTEGSVSVFPLMLIKIFFDVLDELKISKVRCEFEGDSEVACLSRTLNCPVLSYDSDYYIFDILYIPFSTFDMCLSRRKSGTNKYNYVTCQIYRVEKFLNLFGGLDKSCLPLVAVLLGNDYIKRSLFNEFYQQLKNQRSKTVNPQQKRIKSVIMWLQNETVNSAIKKILSRYKVDKRNILAERINNVIKGYNLFESKLLKYLDINNDNNIKPICYDEIDLISEINMDVEEDVEGSEDSDLEEEVESVNLENLYKLPEVFLENYRKCRYPPCFMDLITQNKYYCNPQIEDFNLPHSHIQSVNIMPSIHKILTGSTEGLTYIARYGTKNIKMYALPPTNLDLPTYIEIQTMDKITRKTLLLKILNIDCSFLENTLSKFPEDWHLFIIAIKHFYSIVNPDEFYLYSFILSAIVINYVDSQIGFVRCNKSFHSRFDKILQKLDTTSVCNLPFTIIEAVQKIDKDNSVLCMNNLIHYFQMDAKMRCNTKLYNNFVIHKLAEFQSFVLHIGFLNSVLNDPFQMLHFHHFYDGTFIYNICLNFKKRTNLELYVKTLLSKCPLVLNSFELIVNELKIACSTRTNIKKKRNKRRNSAKKTELPQETTDVSIEENEEMIYDPNNKFAMLSTLQ